MRGDWQVITSKFGCSFALSLNTINFSIERSVTAILLRVDVFSEGQSDLLSALVRYLK